jgi:acetyltransferase-like isoleucine patch superfamily enzyme
MKRLLGSCLGALYAALPNEGVFCRMRRRYWRRCHYEIGEGTWIFRNVHLQGKVVIGRNCAVSDNCLMNGGTEGIWIGDHVMIAPNCVLVAFGHSFHDLATPMMLQPWTYAKIVIDDDVWIGANCTITQGVRLGRGCIVGAGSVVTKDVEPYAVVGGVPARFLRSRLAPVASKTRRLAS